MCCVDQIRSKLNVKYEITCWKEQTIELNRESFEISENREKQCGQMKFHVKQNSWQRKYTVVRRQRKYKREWELSCNGSHQYRMLHDRMFHVKQVRYKRKQPTIASKRMDLQKTRLNNEKGFWKRKRQSRKTYSICGMISKQERLYIGYGRLQIPCGKPHVSRGTNGYSCVMIAGDDI